ncbi:aldose 1-epimerase [Solirubrobacter phytolaccae]|uniref:Aldose 1-epimerase n=1 Tax=Solirubrobacter phytolaccae TaxID=1404360 RepID=A0A9X3NCS6_9ACTN|nr:aldose 1-epimerase [Solirubrobacter phytolaccae]MDA0181601.1 aldose 1-epimerase [Solirubrobacter phytolaccae]
MSLRHDGEELLGDVTAHVPDRPWARGIPLLHPWANRLGGFAYMFDGTPVELDPADLYLEEHGLPLHGLRRAVTGWALTEHTDTRAAAAHRVEGFAGFPFDHEIAQTAELDARRLTITTTIRAGERPVPIAFGHHPFFQLPGVPRAEWALTLPVAERIVVDANLIPTGERTPAGALDGPLGDRTFDDGYTYGGTGAFVLEGGGRRIEVAFEDGYAYAQVFAPAIADIVCFEPMTAPADALRHGPDSVPSGGTFSARFSVTIDAVSER